MGRLLVRRQIAEKLGYYIQIRNNTIILGGPGMNLTPIGLVVSNGTEKDVIDYAWETMVFPTYLPDWTTYVNDAIFLCLKHKPACTHLDIGDTYVDIAEDYGGDIVWTEEYTAGDKRALALALAQLALKGLSVWVNN